MKNKILIEALRLAKSNFHKHPELHNGRFLHWSFIVVNNKIMEWGTNCAGISPPIHLGYHHQIENNELGPKLHSEYVAWKKARDLIKNENWEIINVRLNRTMAPKMSAPCPCCSNFLNSMGCKCAYFTHDSGWAKTLT